MGRPLPEELPTEERIRRLEDMLVRTVDELTGTMRRVGQLENLARQQGWSVEQFDR